MQIGQPLEIVTIPDPVPLPNFPLSEPVVEPVKEPIPA